MAEQYNGTCNSAARRAPSCGGSTSCRVFSARVWRRSNSSRLVRVWTVGVDVDLRRDCCCWWSGVIMRSLDWWPERRAAGRDTSCGAATQQHKEQNINSVVVAKREGADGISPLNFGAVWKLSENVFVQKHLSANAKFEAENLYFGKIKS